MLEEANHNTMPGSPRELAQLRQCKLRNAEGGCPCQNDWQCRHPTTEMAILAAQKRAELFDILEKHFNRDNPPTRSE